MARIAIFGSSYVVRFEKYCDGDIKVPGHVEFFGHGGMCTTSIPGELFESLIDFRPELVILWLGGNDISHDSSPRMIYERLCNIALELKLHGVKKVFVCEVIERGCFEKSKSSGLLTAVSFNRQRKKINSLLASSSDVSVLRMNKIKYDTDYNTDLVHLNDSGWKKFFYIGKGLMSWWANVLMYWPDLWYMGA